MRFRVEGLAPIEFYRVCISMGLDRVCISIGLYRICISIGLDRVCISIGLDRTFRPTAFCSFFRSFFFNSSAGLGVGLVVEQAGLGA